MRALALSTVLLLLVSACGGTPDDDAVTVDDDAADDTTDDAEDVADEDPADGPEGTLVVGIEDLGDEVWAPFLGSFQGTQVIDAVGDHLIRRDFETMELVPGLAESWEVSEDGTTWEFTLREGIPFHDDWGVVTSEDVEFTWSQFFDERTIHPRASIYQEAVAEDMANFEIVSDTVFRVHADEPMPLLPQELATGQLTMPIQSKAYWDEVGEEQAVAHPIGTGPFKFVSHVANSEVVLEAVDDHWRQTPSIQTVVFRMVPDPATRLSQVQSGDVDIASISLSQKPAAESAGLDLSRIEFVGTTTIHVGGWWEGNPNHDPDAPWIQDDDRDAGLAVREAMALAIDRQAILDRLLYGEGRLLEVPLRGYIPGDYPWNDPSWETFSYDADRARELLAEGGYPDGFSVQMPMFVQPHAGAPPSLEISEAVAGYWEEIGLEVERQPTEWQPGMRERVREWDTVGTAYLMASPAYPEPAPGLAVGYSSFGVVQHVVQPWMDDYILRVNSEPDFDERMRLSREFAELLMEDMTSIPMFSLNALYASQSGTIGEWPTLAGFSTAHNLEYMTLAR